MRGLVVRQDLLFQSLPGLVSDIIGQTVVLIEGEPRHTVKQPTLWTSLPFYVVSLNRDVWTISL